MKKNPWIYGLIPIGAVYTVFFLFPMLAFLAASLFEHTGPGSFNAELTYENYANLLDNQVLHRAIFGTLNLSFITSIFGILVGFPIAHAICRGGRGGGILFIIAMATLFSSQVALAMGWQALLANGGIVNRALMASGLIESPLQLSNNYTAVVIGTVHAVLPVAILALIPVCETVSRAQMEASEGLGASRLRTFFHVMLPQTRNGLIVAGITIFAITASAFTTPALLGGGRVALLSLMIRQQLLQVFNYPRAAAISVVLVLLVGLLVITARIIGNRRVLVLRESGK